MPQIFELFGYRLEDRSAEAEACRKAARCPFMQMDCDGGGNRYLSHVPLSKKAELRRYFTGKTIVPSGVCSIQPNDGERPWIVCPRRLLVLKSQEGKPPKHQDVARRMLFGYSGFARGTRLGVWPEVKMKYREPPGGADKIFDYSFDYILTPVGRRSRKEVEVETGESWGEVRPIIEAAGYSLSRREGGDCVEDFPHGAPLLVEIMTCSTSGGNKEKRTTIPMAFEDAVLGKSHEAPGINYRQVWARMVSQLVVKSEVAMAWGGNAFWILQDALVDYISRSTALDLHQFPSGFCRTPL